MCFLILEFQMNNEISVLLFGKKYVEFCDCTQRSIEVIFIRNEIRNESRIKEIPRM